MTLLLAFLKGIFKLDLKVYEPFISVLMGLLRILRKTWYYFEPKKPPKSSDFRDL